MAVLEAAAQGVPVVASAVGGIPELVPDGATGLLVPPGDVDALAGALTSLLEHPEEAAAMGRAAWARVRERHDPAAHVAALLDLYTAVR
jgi:glycosyltransferase involved in cell wall biosynthesis